MEQTTGGGNLTLVSGFNQTAYSAAEKLLLPVIAVNFNPLIKTENNR
jgi:hypothetical protein